MYLASSFNPSLFNVTDTYKSTFSRYLAEAEIEVGNLARQSINQTPSVIASPDRSDNHYRPQSQCQLSTLLLRYRLHRKNHPYQDIPKALAHR